MMFEKKKKNPKACTYKTKVPSSTNWTESVNLSAVSEKQPIILAEEKPINSPSICMQK